MNATPRLKTVLKLAKKESDDLNHRFILPEHLLLGWIKSRYGAAFSAALRAGVDLDWIYGSVRSSFTRIVGPWEKEEGEAKKLAPRSNRILRLAELEARELGHSYVGVEHLVLGIIADADNEAAKALDEHISLPQLRDVVLRELDPAASVAGAVAAVPDPVEEARQIVTRYFRERNLDLEDAVTKCIASRIEFEREKDAQIERLQRRIAILEAR